MKANTQTSNVKKLTQTLSIKEIQDLIEQRVIKKTSVKCEVCNTVYTSTLCPSCEETERIRIVNEENRKQEECLVLCKNAQMDCFLFACGIPNRYINIKSNQDGRSLFFTGSSGTGKTYKAIEIMKNHVEQLPATCFKEPFTFLSYFITVPELLLKIRSTFSLDRCEEEIVDKYSNCKLLVLDDLGAEKTSEFSLQILYIILNRRYNEQLQTILTSNLSLDDIREKLGDRIASRIAGMCQIVKLTGKDRRLKTNLDINS